jgi:molybdopterin-biosynthesis enzyme MoeA-like protein
MELHDEMSVLLKDKMNNGDQTAELSDAQKKMATIPSASKLRYLSDNESDWPVLQCHNIFVLPGVPQFFEQKIENVAKYLSCQLERSEAYKVVLLVDEDSIVPILNRVVENHPDVCIGSYPFVSRPDYKTVITVEGRLQTKMIRSNSTVFDKDLIDQPKKAMDKKVELALDDLITTLPQGSVLRVDRNDMLL